MSTHAPDEMILSTTFTLEGYRIREYRGLVRGVVVRAPTITQGVMGGLRSIVGGQIQEYTAQPPNSAGRPSPRDWLLANCAWMISRS